MPLPVAAVVVVVVVGGGATVLLVLLLVLLPPMPMIMMATDIQGGSEGARRSPADRSANRTAEG